MNLPPPTRRRFKRYIERGLKPHELQSLIPSEDDRPILEEDHVASRQHDPELVAPVCKKGHRRLERNRDAAKVSRKYEPNVVKRTIQRLKSSAVFKELEAEAMWRWAEDLELYLRRKLRERKPKK